MNGSGNGYSLLLRQAGKRLTDSGPTAPGAGARGDLARYGEAVYGLTPAAHHSRWLDLATTPENKRVLIIAPRDSAKTTWMAELLLSWYMGNNPLSTNFIGSVSDDQARKRLNAIKLLVEANPEYATVFPDVRPDPRRGWSGDGLFVKRANMPYSRWMSMVARQGQQKDPTLSAGGVGSSVVVGKRITGLALVDDPHDEKNSATATQRTKVIEWLFKVLMPALTETGRIVIITTRWQLEDVAGHIKAEAEATVKAGQVPQWQIDELPAISMIDGRPVSYWPERWPLERLEEKRREIGSAYFRAMYLNDPAGLAGQVFNLAWFKPLPDTLPTFKRVVIGVDLAISQRAQADFTAIATLATDNNSNLYLLDMRRGHMTFHETEQMIRRIAAATEAAYGKLDRIAVEDVGYQRALIQELRRGEAGNGLVKGYPPEGDKVARAALWAAAAENGDVYADTRAAWWRDFADEAVAFPGGGHDDQIDAVSVGWVALAKKVSFAFV